MNYCLERSQTSSSEEGSNDNFVRSCLLLRLREAHLQSTGSVAGLLVCTSTEPAAPWKGSGIEDDKAVMWHGGM